MFNVYERTFTDVVDWYQSFLLSLQILDLLKDGH